MRAFRHKVVYIQTLAMHIANLSTRTYYFAIQNVSLFYDISLIQPEEICNQTGDKFSRIYHRKLDYFVFL